MKRLMTCITLFLTLFTLSACSQKADIVQENASTNTKEEIIELIDDIKPHLEKFGFTSRTDSHLQYGVYYNENYQVYYDDLDKELLEKEDLIDINMLEYHLEFDTVFLETLNATKVLLQGLDTFTEGEEFQTETRRGTVYMNENYLYLQLGYYTNVEEPIWTVSLRFEILDDDRLVMEGYGYDGSRTDLEYHSFQLDTEKYYRHKSHNNPQSTIRTHYDIDYDVKDDVLELIRYESIPEQTISVRYDYFNFDDGYNYTYVLMPNRQYGQLSLLKGKSISFAMFQSQTKLTTEDEFGDPSYLFIHSLTDIEEWEYVDGLNIRSNEHDITRSLGSPYGVHREYGYFVTARSEEPLEETFFVKALNLYPYELHSYRDYTKRLSDFEKMYDNIYFDEGKLFVYGEEMLTGVAHYDSVFEELNEIDREAMRAVKTALGTDLID